MEFRPDFQKTLENDNVMIIDYRINYIIDYRINYRIDNRIDYRIVYRIDFRINFRIDYRIDIDNTIDYSMKAFINKFQLECLNMTYKIDDD